MLASLAILYKMRLFDFIFNHCAIDNALRKTSFVLVLSDRINLLEPESIIVCLSVTPKG